MALQASQETRQAPVHRADLAVHEFVFDVQQHIHLAHAAGQGGVGKSLWMALMVPIIRQMSIVVILMDSHQTWGCVYGKPWLGYGIKDHPVIPPGAADGEFGDLREQA